MRFIIAEHDVHILDGLAGSSLDQIVDRCDNDCRSVACAFGNMYIAEVRVSNMLNFCHGLPDPDKRRGTVKFTEMLPNL